jgi:EAL domain-containing protein (putative c-di-GMP-specific phosphodiesterase class I)
MEITASIIAMGHTLGFKVLAEGVETPEQLAFIRRKGCDTYQGYIKSKPASAEAFADLLSNQHRVGNEARFVQHQEDQVICSVGGL